MSVAVVLARRAALVWRALVVAEAVSMDILTALLVLPCRPPPFFLTENWILPNLRCPGARVLPRTDIIL